MLFSPEEICTLAFCLQAQTEALSTPQAPLWIGLVSSGRAFFSANSTPQLLSAGGLFLARGALEILPEGSCHALVLGLSGSAAERAAASLAQPLIADSAACPAAPELMGEVSELAAALEQRALPAGPEGQASANLGTQALELQEAPRLSALCYRLLCALSSADSAVPALPPLVCEALLCIREHYADLYGVEELSAQLGVSKSHLVRLFGASMRVTPGQYLTHMRVAAARQMLLHPEYTLDVVASLCGFSGANYLCKVFKKETGETPASYRLRNAPTAPPTTEASERESALYV